MEPETSWKLLSIWLKGLGTFLDKISCKKEANEYKELSMEEIIILSGYLGLWILDNPYARGRIPSLK